MENAHQAPAASEDPGPGEPRASYRLATLGKYMARTGRAIQTVAPALAVFDGAPLPLSPIFGTLGSGLVLLGSWLYKRKS